MIVFADTSALVKLYVDEAGTERMRSLVEAATVAVSVLTYAETHATFARRMREGLFDRQEYEIVTRQFDLEWPACVHVLLDERTQLEIPRLCAQYPLRGGDAVQLSSALLFHREGLELRFACCDQRLLTCAEAEGLRVVDPTAG